MAYTIDPSERRPHRNPPGPRRLARPEGPGTAFANYIIDRQSELGLTNLQISEKLNYKRQNAVSMWKNGASRVPLDALVILADVLETSLEYLMALYFEQFINENQGEVGLDQILSMMSRVVTKDEWEIIKTVREARKRNSVPLRADQKKLLAEAFEEKDLPEGDLPTWMIRPEDVTISTSRDKYARRGKPREDYNITEEAPATPAPETAVRKRSKRKPVAS